jgi:hypothetical protein
VTIVDETGKELAGGSKPGTKTWLAIGAIVAGIIGIGIAIGMSFSGKKPKKKTKKPDIEPKPKPAKEAAAEKE